MIKGMYAAASAMIAGMNRQTVLSHNISNVDTPGFKNIMITMEDWEKSSVFPQQSVEAVWHITGFIFINRGI